MSQTIHEQEAATIGAGFGLSLHTLQVSASFTLKDFACMQYVGMHRMLLKADYHKLALCRHMGVFACSSCQATQLEKLVAFL